MGFLPFRHLLPPYVFGPLLCLISIGLIIFGDPPPWWLSLVFLAAGVWGAWGTVVWFKTGRNIFTVKTRRTENGNT